jgi:hypothetical protein
LELEERSFGQRPLAERGDLGTGGLDGVIDGTGGDTQCDGTDWLGLEAQEGVVIERALEVAATWLTGAEDEGMILGDERVLQLEVMTARPITSQVSRISACSLGTQRMRISGAPVGPCRGAPFSMTMLQARR